MNFRTKYGEKDFIPSEPGKSVVPVYEAYIDEDGHQELRIVGEHDLTEEIQQYREMVSLDNILERFSNGDKDIINRVKGFYADVSNIPVKMQDILNLNLKGLQIWNELPIDIKSQFYSYEDFLMNPGKLQVNENVDVVFDKKNENKDVIDNDDEE